MTGNSSHHTIVQPKDPQPSKTRGLLWRLACAVPVVGSLALAVLLVQPRSWCPNTYGGLMGEELLDSPARARDYADRSVQEAYNIWAEPSSNWQVMHDDRDIPDSQQQVVVECRRITEGPFANSTTIHLARAEGILKLRGVSLQEAYEFMVSPEGFAVIDPASDPKEFGKPIQVIPDWTRGKSQIEESYVPALGPFLAQRHFVVLNSFLPDEQLFVSKSVLHPARPGASRFYQGNEINYSTTTTTDSVRALNTFAIKLEPLETNENAEHVDVVQVKLKMVNYIDLLFIPETLMSFLSCKAMLPNLFQNFQKAFDEGRHKKQLDSLQPN